MDNGTSPEVISQFDLSPERLRSAAASSIDKVKVRRSLFGRYSLDYRAPVPSGSRGAPGRG